MDVRRLVKVRVARLPRLDADRLGAFGLGFGLALALGLTALAITHRQAVEARARAVGDAILYERLHGRVACQYADTLRGTLR